MGMTFLLGLSVLTLIYYLVLIAMNRKRKLRFLASSTAVFGAVSGASEAEVISKEVTENPPRKPTTDFETQSLLVLEKEKADLALKIDLAKESDLETDMVDLIADLEAEQRFSPSINTGIYRS